MLIFFVRLYCWWANSTKPRDSGMWWERNLTVMNETRFFFLNFFHNFHFIFLLRTLIILFFNWNKIFKTDFTYHFVFMPFEGNIYTYNSHGFLNGRITLFVVFLIFYVFSIAELENIVRSYGADVSRTLLSK